MVRALSFLALSPLLSAKRKSREIDGGSRRDDNKYSLVKPISEMAR